MLDGAFRVKVLSGVILEGNRAGQKGGWTLFFSLTSPLDLFILIVCKELRKVFFLRFFHDLF